MLEHTRTIASPRRRHDATNIEDSRGFAIPNCRQISWQRVATRDWREPSRLPWSSPQLRESLSQNCLAWEPAQCDQYRGFTGFSAANMPERAVAVAHGPPSAQTLTSATVMRPPRPRCRTFGCVEHNKSATLFSFYHTPGILLVALQRVEVRLVIAPSNWVGLSRAFCTYRGKRVPSKLTRVTIGAL